MIRTIFLAISFLLLHSVLLAQNGNTVEMADTMRSNGRIYVVVAVVLTIFAGIIIYLVRLDRRISKLEKNINS